MTVTDVTARIGQIQAQLAALDAPTFSGSPDYAAIFEQITKPGDSAITKPITNGDTTVNTGGTGGTGDGTVQTGSGVTGDQIVDEAKKYLGVPYVWGGESPSGMDCSGMIQYVYSQFGIDLPRVSYEQATAGKEVEGGLANAQPGDILAFNSPVSHVGIYIGDNKMIHAPRPGEQVRIEDVYDTPTAVRRVLPETTGATDVSVPAGTPYASLFVQEGAEHGVSPALLAAIAKQESGYDPKAVSSAGAQGLMQLMPATASGLGVSNSFDPAQAVDGAARLMKSLLGEFGSTELALAAYNAGPGAVHRYDGIPPYPETQNYVTSIQGILNSFGQAAA
jgi:cell wall-associated NlpC family hydrolase